MWFTETSWPPIIICCILAVLLIAQWYNTGRDRNLIGVGVLAVLGLSIYWIEISIVTERERVTENIYGITSAFQQKELEKTLDYVSVNAGDVRKLVEAAHHLVDVRNDLSVTDVQVTMMSDNSRAVTRFRANASLSVQGYGDVGRRPSYWEVTWQSEGDEWRIIRVQRLNPVSGEQMGILDRAPH
jgi:hypothetical protein